MAIGRVEGFFPPRLCRVISGSGYLVCLSFVLLGCGHAVAWRQ
jgi:hypothetical protein